jgi:peroxiredoxin
LFSFIQASTQVAQPLVILEIILSALKRITELLGVSADAQAKQAKFKEKIISVPLLADEDKSVIEAFGVWGPKNLWEKNTMGFTERLL